MTQLKGCIGAIVCGLMFILVAILPSFASAWSNNSIYNGSSYLTTENLSSETLQSFIRNLSVPQNTILTKGFINLTLIYNEAYEKICYQESANVSTACGGMNTGGYDNGLSPAGGDGSVLYDGNWGTGAAGYGGGQIILRVNYTKPLGAINTSLWLVKDTGGEANLSVANCWNTYIDKIELRASSDGGTSITWQCRNKSLDFEELRLAAGAGTGYEEAMNWNITSYATNVSVNIGNNKFNFTGQLQNIYTNLASYINSYLSGCSYSGGYCQVPINFTLNNGTLNYDNLLFSNEGFLENSQSYNTSTYETKSESFILNLTYDNFNYTSISANLIYNGTAYAGTKVGTGSNILFTKTIDIPTSSLGTKNFYWNVSMTNSSGTSYFSSNAYNQTVSSINLALCNSTINVPYINFTFKDETSMLNLNASIVSSTFEYYLGSGSQSKTLNFINASENYNYAFCFSPQQYNLRIIPYVQYSSTGYPQRIYDPGVLTLTNVTTNKTLYLLSSTDGQYVTFQVINSAEQVLSGVSVTISRTIASEEVVIATGTTGASGTVAFWLNPDFIHTASFSLAPYDNYTLTQAFTNTEYTVSLGGATTTNVSNYHQGISYSVIPIYSYLSNGTFYNFNFTISSSYWALDSFGFNITNEDGDLIGTSTGSGSTGGSALLNISTGNNETFYMTYYWIINGSYIIASTNWPILDLSDSSFSIAHLLSDFSAYVITGLFGLDSFGIGIICFIIILTVTGTVKLKYGISDEATIIGLIFSLVALLDVSFGLIPNPIGAVPHFPTILMGILFSGFLFKEVFQ